MLPNTKIHAKILINAIDLGYVYDPEFSSPWAPLDALMREYSNDKSYIDLMDQARADVMELWCVDERNLDGGESMREWFGLAYLHIIVYENSSIAA